MRSLFSVIDSLRYQRNITAALDENHPPFSPHVNIILPCKGLEPGFENNVAALLNQSYPSFKLICITEAIDDPAYPVLEKLSAEDVGSKMTLATAGRTRDASQKIHNLLAGLQRVENHARVLAFADSDIRVHKDWLQNLVAPLQEKSIGAATGYRWYMPIPGNFWSAVRSVWNMTSANLLFSDVFNFAWGGSLAIRKKTFAELRIAEKWRGGLSDDMILSNAVKAAGYKIKFAPQSLAISSEPISFSSLLEWTTRQLAMIRLYDPKLWRLAAYPQWTFNLIFIIGVTLIGYGLFTASKIPFAAWLMVSDAVFGGVINSIRFSAFQRALPAHRGEMRRFWWAYAGLHLISSFVMSLALLKSLTTNRIIWRGIEYEISGSGEIVVLNELSIGAVQKVDFQ
jgi:cellulose synthase/poly-beta-1,6-N-acetylglucosamine synthase-like glycosyltransferase